MSGTSFVPGGSSGTSSLPIQPLGSVHTTVLLADTEIMVNLAVGTRWFKMWARDKSVVKIAYDTGDIAGGNYWLNMPGVVYMPPGMVSGLTKLYVTTSKPNEVIIIEHWG